MPSSGWPAYWVMNEEYFDEVNVNNDVMGPRTRTEIHRLALRHRAAHILVYNQRGQLFLQKRAPGKECFPNTWDASVSGHVQSGESYLDCAQREAQEELGLVPTEPLEKLFEVDACPETGMEFLWVYRTHSEGPFMLQADEISDGQWFATDHVALWMRERPQDFAGAMPLIWNLLYPPE